MAIGHNLERSFQQQELQVNPDLVARAVKDVLASNTLLLTPPQMQEVLTVIQNDARAKYQAKQMQQQVLNAKNTAAGVSFLLTNKYNPGVVTLPDGLEYRVMTAGAGATPTPNDTVTVNYRGTLVDGTEFDSSYKRGQPATFPVTGVIRGWTEALTKMKVGSKWQLFIPADLAYGPQGRPGIPPNSALIFEVELLSVQSPPPAASPRPSSNPPLTSDIIKVPSAEELKQGAKIEVIKAEDAQKMQQQQLQQPTNN